VVGTLLMLQAAEMFKRWRTAGWFCRLSSLYCFNTLCEGFSVT